MPANNQLSPGVVVLERDLSANFDIQQGNVGVIAGPFEWGPVNQVVENSEEQEVVDRFGGPDDYNYEHWFSGVQFLQYGGLLKTIRTDSTDLKNAVSDGTDTPVTPVKIQNTDVYEQTFEEPASANNWEFAVRYPGARGNSIRMFITDAGADQIAVLPAPGSGNEWKFTSGDALTAASGASGKVYSYRIQLTVTTVVGAFVPGAATTIDISGSAESVDVLSFDAKKKILEIGIPVAGVTGIISDAQVVTQGTNTAVIAATGIQRQLLSVTDKGSINFAAADSLEDADSNSVAVTSVRVEYNEREYLPGQKWINVAPRPSTTRFASEKGGFRDELHVLVFDYDGGITGTPYALLEKHIGLSKASDAKSTVGETNYYKEVLKQLSDWILWGEHTAQTFTVGASAAAGNWGLSVANRSFNVLKSGRGNKVEPSDQTTFGSKGGSTVWYDFVGGASYTVSNSQYQFTSDDLNTAYSLIADPESEDVDFLISGPAGGSRDAGLAKITHLISICEQRKDCMAFFSPLRSNIIGRTDGDEIAIQIQEYFDGAGASSYAVFDSGYKYIYDKYNDKFRYVPCNGDIAGLVLDTALTEEPWFSPAGFNRGNIRNSIRLAYSPAKDQRDKLYSSRVNPVVTFPGQGTVLFGDKTAQGFKSAFDRINVRRLFIVIEDVIADAAQSVLFEQNDDITRSSFVGLCEPYLRDVQGRRGIIDYLVKCDSSNNPQDAVDRGEFYAEIFIKPTPTINYITLTFTATRSGVAFEEAGEG